MEAINSKKLAEIVYSTSNVIDADIREIVTDSRKAHKTCAFVAIKGEKFDGHDFVKQVIEQGCPVAIVSRLLKDVPAVRQMALELVLKEPGRRGERGFRLPAGHHGGRPRVRG